MSPRQQSNPGRARILEAAIKLVAEGGYASATINEVCRLAGVRPPAVYYHYGNKDGLVAAVVETVATAWLDGLESVAREGSSFEDRLNAGLRGWRALILEDRSPIQLLIRVQLECRPNAPTIPAALISVMARARTIIAGAVEGVVGPLADADELAQTIVSLLQGAALRHHLENDIEGLDRRLTEIGNTITALVDARRQIRANAEETR
jgi:AcrR family transcriptional regulator